MKCAASACPVLKAVEPDFCRLRDLNDEINKLIREKGHCEMHCKT